MSTFTKVLIICSLSFTLHSMESEELVLDSTHEAIFDEGKDTIVHFFTSKNLSSSGEALHPDELLAFILPSPDDKDPLPFNDFKWYYEGVFTGLNSINHKKVPKKKAALYKPLLLFCKLMKKATSYEDILLTPHQKKRWLDQCADLEGLLQDMSLPSSDQDERLEKATVCELISQGDIAIIHDIIIAMDTQINDGNVTSDDIEWMFEVLTSLIGIKVTQHDFADQESHQSYLTTLTSFGKKILFCKQAPQILYLDDDDDICSYENDARYAAQCFTECLAGTYLLSNRMCIKSTFFDSLSYLISFISGMSAGLSCTSKTFGKIYALEKLSTFLKELPQKVTLLEESDSSQKDEYSFSELISTSKKLVGLIRQIVDNVRDMNSDLLKAKKA